jgi:proteic killer suppression protein
MEITFLDDDLREICEKEKIAKRKIGALSAKKLKTRLADIRAVNIVTDLVAGHPHPLEGDRRGEFSLRLHDGHRLVFVPDLIPVPFKESDSVDWSKVTKIKIIYIGDYHD